MGRVLIKSSLGMSMEIIQAFLFWEKVSPDDRYLVNASAIQATSNTIVAMSLNIFQMEWRGLAVSWVVDHY